MRYPPKPGRRDAIGRYTTGYCKGRRDLPQSRSAADEVMVTTMVHDHGERLASYGRLAEALGLVWTPVGLVAT